MAVSRIDVGRTRGPADGSRRYTPVNFQFDTRVAVLENVVDDSWEDSIKLQWRANQASVRESVIHEFGAHAYERKIADFTALGAAPWSVDALHNVYLSQVRAAFTGSNYYPALLGACGLGERILNQLVLTLREDYPDHTITQQVEDKNSFDNWSICIKVLSGWGVFSEDLAKDFTKLMKRRHAAVHYRQDLDSGDARSAALEAILLLGDIVDKLFAPLGDRPYFFTGPIGRSYVRLESEGDPFVKRFILPACVLVSPVFRFVNAAGGFDVYDDPDYGSHDPPLTDDQYSEPSRAAHQVEAPF